MTGLATPEAAVRLRLRVTGLVQGVGFRPHVHRLAGALGLAGHVGNDTEGVFAEVEGPAPAVDEFLDRLVADAPAPARIQGVESGRRAADGRRGFAIVESRGRGEARTFVSPDIATCDDCLAELFDPSDRRARYPFTNCTNCGPRFTITLRLPYDRPNTTMRGFGLCDDCAAEYGDPADRRFHAQPVAVPVRAPAVVRAGSRRRSAGRHRSRAPTPRWPPPRRRSPAATSWPSRASAATTSPATPAPTRPSARLRVRKQRVEKPFAVMVPGLEAAAALAELDPEEARLLASPQRPIVLVRRRLGAAVSALVAPGNPRLGPAPPLHAVAPPALRPGAGPRCRPEAAPVPRRSS